MILLAGGTGRLGALVAKRLQDQNLRVRILTRDPARAEHLASELVTVVRGDVRDPESVAAATAGTTAVVSAVHGFAEPQADSLQQIDRDGNANLIDAAKASGAEFVLISIVGAAPDSPMELFRSKHAAERYAIESGVPTTIVRATAFLELWVELLEQTAGRSGRPVVFGRGQNPINFVSVQDVAALVERVVVNPAGRDQVLEIGGPENLTFDQLASAVQTAAGRTGQARHLRPPMLRVMANTIGRVKPQLGRQVRAALAMDHTDLTFDTAPVHELYSDLPCTSVDDLLAGPRRSELQIAGSLQRPVTR